MAKINVWQAQRLSELMTAHDDLTDDTLKVAHADLRNLNEDGRPEDGGYLLEVRWEDGQRVVLWGDGVDVTDEYVPEVTTEETSE
jgi:hypothetical protein